MRAARAAALAAAALAAFTGCGGDDDDQGDGPAAPAGKEIAGSIVQYADCRDWSKATDEERRATVVELRNQLTPQDDPTPESSLDDGRAYEILDNACKPKFADSLRLYKLYVRAQGFAPLSE